MKLSTIAAILAGFTLAGAAAAQPPASFPVPNLAPPPELIQWTQRPEGSDFAEVYPAQARRRTQDGRVVLECVANDKGRMTQCTVLSQEPEGMGFGEAGLKLAHLFRVKTTTSSGQSVVGAKITVPLEFRSR